MSNIPEIIIEKIKKNDPKVHHLDLFNLGLNDDDISELQELLQKNLYINSLNLAYNNITYKGCEMLSLIPTLKKVEIFHCPIGDRGIAALVNAKIDDLDVSYCGISNEGAKLLLENLHKYDALLVSGNPAISSEILEQIRRKFVKSPKVSSVPVDIDLGLNIHSLYGSYFDSTIKIAPININQHDETLAIYEQLNEFAILLEKIKEKAELLANSNVLSHLDDSSLKDQASKVVSSIMNLSKPLEEMEKTLSSVQKKHSLTPQQ